MNNTVQENKNLQAELKKEMAKLKLNFDRLVREQRPLIMDEACKFVEEKGEIVTRLLTRQHRKIVQQFIEFKERSARELKEARKMQDHVVYLETMCALKSPCMQAEHVIDDATELTLYNCLVPKLREHRKFKLFKHK